jgi:membrane associated rhomboid family serine protease
MSDLDLPPEVDWQALPSDLYAPRGETVLDAARLRNWTLTLAARQIPYAAAAVPGGWQLLVPPPSFAIALDELRRFEAENRNWPPPLPPATPLLDNLLVTLSALGLLAIFHNLVYYHLDLFGLPSVDWIGRGNAAAGAIRSGEWWRAVTALTLHADGLHLLGNLLIGGAFIALLCRTLGSGLGWTLLLASGTLGNLLNAVTQDGLHRSVGASTAVFGAVGLLAALNLFRAGGGLRKRWHLSLVAALALLALLGSEGENTDLGAPLFGFAAGLVLGLPTARLLARRGRPGPWLDAALGLAALALVCGAWWAALRFS